MVNGSMKGLSGMRKLVIAQYIPSITCLMKKASGKPHGMNGENVSFQSVKATRRE